MDNDIVSKKIKNALLKLGINEEDKIENILKDYNSCANKKFFRDIQRILILAL
ncbi:MAG: hypothetical protein WC376_01490 [Candidatus Nanoarchaeia archaeon]|jgi:hypothetical protein